MNPFQFPRSDRRSERAFLAVLAGLTMLAIAVVSLTAAWGLAS